MKVILKYGLWVGGIVVVYAMLEFAVGLHGKYLSIGQYSGYLRYVVLAAGIFVGVKESRDLAGRISYVRALGIGICISLVAAAIITVFEILYVEFINPGFTQDYIDFNLGQLEAANASPEKISELLEQAKTWSATKWQLLFYMGQTMGLGLIFSLIAAAILKSKK